MGLYKIMYIFSSYLLLLFFITLWMVQGIEGSKAEYVTCGSMLKLINKDLGLRLHSHDVKYGSGSGQQSVTGVEDPDDHNSHWIVRPVEGETCKRGVPIKCNSKIRLQHATTKKNLHSHYFDSPLSGPQGQEVSCYGDEDGVGDSGDHWILTCNNGDFWRRDSRIKLQHVDTGAYLAASGRSFGRPISGQGEIVGISQYGSHTEWQAMEGLFVHPTEPTLHGHHHVHSEL